MSSTAATPPSSTAGKPGAYEIGKPMGRCHVSGGEITPGTRFIAALRETPTGFERLDLSLDAWRDFEPKSELLAFWQAVMPEPTKKAKLFVDDSVLCDLFERLAGADEPAKISFRFVLGLILMRKRLLIYEGTRNVGGSEIWSVRLKGRSDPMEMVDPRLSEDQLGEVTQQLGQVLNSEL